MATLADDARVEPDEVKEIIDTDLTNSQINAFINSAHYHIQDNLLNKGLSAYTLTQIELWLSAHFLAIRDQRVESEGVAGEWQARYQGKTGMGLQSTTYGQQAIALDTTGTLASSGLKAITFEVYSEQDSASYYD